MANDGCDGNTLRLISLLVLFSSLLGLSVMLLSSLRERRREIALRAIGASPFFVFMIIQTEALLITLTGVLVAMLALTMSIQFAQSFLVENYGVFIDSFAFNSETLGILSLILAGTLLLGLIPALSAYRMSLHYGLATRS